MSWLRQSTAETVVLGPFVDDTDGKTAETALTISQADIRLSKNGGAFAQTNNAAGATHMENGYYSVPLNTTDTNTLGRLRVAVSESGALPVWRDFMVLPQQVWDSFFGADRLQVHVDEMTAGIITAAVIATDAIDNDALAANAITEIQSGLATSVALDTVDNFLDTEIADIQARLPAALVGGRMDASVGAMAANTLTASALAADAVTEIQSGLSTLDAAGVRSAVGLASANLDTQIGDLPTNAELATSQAAADDATLAAIAALNNLSAAQVNAEVDAALADYDGPTFAELDARTDAIDAALVVIDDFLDTEISALTANVAAILDDTGNTGVVVAAASKSGYALSATGLDAIPITAPTTVATTFREVVIQVWRRLFKKTTLDIDLGEIKTYADNGSTVVTTQTVSDDGTIQTVNSAT